MYRLQIWWALSTGVHTSYESYENPIIRVLLDCEIF
jgi:hypothetical protein